MQNFATTNAKKHIAAVLHTIVKSKKKNFFSTPLPSNHTFKRYLKISNKSPDFPKSPTANDNSRTLTIAHYAHDSIALRDYFLRDATVQGLTQQSFIKRTLTVTLIVSSSAESDISPMRFNPTDFEEIGGLHIGTGVRKDSALANIQRVYAMVCKLISVTLSATIKVWKKKKATIASGSRTL